MNLKNINININMNRDKAALILLVAGVLFLAFYWTYAGFSSATVNAETRYNDTMERTSSALDLYLKTLTTPTQAPKVEEGLLTFVEKSAETLGLSNRLGDMKPINVKGGESVSFRVDSLTGDEAVSFIRMLEGRSNIKLTAVKISKRFDNEQRLNLVVTAEKS
ncbi:hypothetical protein [Seleniivibrio woodruffii]|uniref:hypothetical protein n=1 Tax=Seleniivibrio woodruffii TaxID=1078050 RepID=UPI00240A93C3|nr:hypothetical protein [Seleniivibrio woodruffii]